MRDLSGSAVAVKNPSSAAGKGWRGCLFSGLEVQVVHVVQCEVLSAEVIVVEGGLEDCGICEAGFAFCV